MMNLIYGEVVSLNERDPMKMARIKIGGAIKEVSIGLLTGVRIGDRVLLCDGVAIGKVTDAVAANENHVSRDSR